MSRTSRQDFTFCKLDRVQFPNVSSSHVELNFLQKAPLPHYPVLIMTKKAIIERTVAALDKLPQQKVEEIFNFVEYVLSQVDENLLSEGVQKIAAEGSSFDFLRTEEDLYSLKDLKEVYNGKGWYRSDRLSVH